MYNTQSDNITLGDTGIPGGAAVDKLGSTIKNLASGIRNKAKAKKAQGFADRHEYFALSPFQKSLIPIPQYVIDKVGGLGISERAILDLPPQGMLGWEDTLVNLKKLTHPLVYQGTTVVNKSASGEDTTTVVSTSNMKKYIPYIIGVVVLAVVIYFIVKRK
jgi:hypothetical protein